MALSEKKKKKWEDTLKELELIDEGDEILEHSQADYWKQQMIGKSQVRGNMFFTKERFVFCSGFGIANVSFRYNQIKALRTCFVSLFPTGIEITTNEEKYVISVMKRKQWLALLQEKAQL